MLSIPKASLSALQFTNAPPLIRLYKQLGGMPDTLTLTKQDEGPILKRLLLLF
jgi:hypothetical protein